MYKLEAHIAQQGRDAAAVDEDPAQCRIVADIQARLLIGRALTVGPGGRAFLNSDVLDNETLFFEKKYHTLDGVVIDDLEISRIRA